ADGLGAARFPGRGGAGRSPARRRYSRALDLRAPAAFARPGLAIGCDRARRMSPHWRIKRIYEPADKADGTRVLVDRLWPRGLSREDAAIDLWLKTIAPSAELRQWFDHKPERWD